MLPLAATTEKAKGVPWSPTLLASVHRGQASRSDSASLQNPLPMPHGLGSRTELSPPLPELGP